MSHRPKTLEFNSPLLSFEMESYADRRQIIAMFAAWFAFWGLTAIGVLYLYIAVLPTYIGFESTALLGIGLATLSAMQQQ